MDSPPLEGNVDVINEPLYRPNDKITTRVGHEEYRHLNRAESPNLQMINESEFVQHTLEIGLPKSEPYIQRDSITNKKIYVPRLKTIQEY